MKVGMDSLLLGNWTDPFTAKTILDIGTGCGILALMMAAKSNAEIEAIELDPASAKEAGENFHNSPFHRRLKIINEDFVFMATRSMKKYDLIITNPPFFINDQKSLTHQKLNARHAESLSYEQLAAGGSMLLNEGGLMYLVLPYAESKTFIKAAATTGLHLQKQMLIFPLRGYLPNRINMQFGLQKPESLVTEKFIIREEDGNFTRQYVLFFKDHYIGLK